jgi:dTDP-D-glucose 4,6-dehydratase
MRSLQTLILACVVMSVSLALLNRAYGLDNRVGGRAESSQKNVSCEEALKNSSKVKAGMTEPEVLDLMGTPTVRVEDRWGYDFRPCVKPPQPGQQLILAMEILFSEGLVKDIKWAWVDATGPAPSSSPKPRKKKPSA